jgi:hypothetical protein
MGERLGVDDVDRLWRHFEHTAFRFETLPVYRIESERALVAEFLAGEPDRVTFVPRDHERSAQINTMIGQGKQVSRVRILHEPPTGYERWQLRSGQIATGERFRWIPYGRARSVGLPVEAGDWWLFDSCRLVRLRFAPDGTPLGGELVSDPAAVVQHAAWRDLALHVGLPRSSWAPGRPAARPS